ncbi:hypothetical protein ACVQ90_00260 [Staphylococcus aureus]
MHCEDHGIVFNAMYLCTKMPSSSKRINAQ